MKKIVFSLLFVGMVTHAMELNDHDHNKAYRGSTKSFVEKLKSISPMEKENCIAAAIWIGVAIADLAYLKSGDIYFFAGTELIKTFLNNNIIESQHELLKKIKSKKIGIALKGQATQSNNSFIKNIFMHAGLGFTGIIFSAFNRSSTTLTEQAIQRWTTAIGMSIHDMVNYRYIIKNQIEINNLIKS